MKKTPDIFTIFEKVFLRLVTTDSDDDWHEAESISMVNYGHQKMLE